MRFFHTFVGSFYSDATYRAVRNGPGHGLAYSFLLVALSSLVAVIVLLYLLHRTLFTPYYGPEPVFDSLVRQVGEQLPVMTLKDNRLMTKEPGKHPIDLKIEMGEDSYEGRFAVIDTSGDTTYENMDVPVLVTDKALIIKNESKNETRIRNFAELTKGQNPTIVINHAMIEALGTEMVDFIHRNLTKGYFVLGIFGWIGVTLVMYVLRLCMLIVLALAGLLIGQCLRMKVPFNMAMRVAAVSYTPVVVITGTLFLWIGAEPSRLWLVICGCIMLTAALFISRDTPLADNA